MSSILEYKGYHASIEYDAEDNIFVGEVIWNYGLFELSWYISG